MRWKILAVKYMQAQNSAELWQGIDESWPGLSDEEKSEIFQFLYNSGQWKMFAQLHLREFAFGAVEPSWLHLLAIFALEKIELSKSDEPAILDKLKELGVSLESVEHFDQLIAALKQKRKFNFLTAVQEKKQELLASIKIAKSERLYDQQLNYLEELYKRFPNDTSIRQNLHQRQVNDAEQVLHRSKKYQPTISEEAIKQRKEEEPFIKNLINQCEKKAKKDPSIRVDVAIMLRQMGYPREGLAFIEKFDEDERIAWLLFDFLLSAKQYIALLDHCEQMKIRFAHRAEALFAISYFEALTFWELGERTKAIDLMRYISQMKPSFRFASELLYRWQEEAN